jgi:hypothetical protein
MYWSFSTTQQCAPAERTCEGGATLCDCLGAQIYAASGGAVAIIPPDVQNGCGDSLWRTCDEDAGFVESYCFDHVCYGSPPMRRRARVG